MKNIIKQEKPAFSSEEDLLKELLEQKEANSPKARQLTYDEELKSPPEKLHQEEFNIDKWLIEYRYLGSEESYPIKK